MQDLSCPRLHPPTCLESVLHLPCQLLHAHHCTPVVDSECDWICPKHELTSQSTVCLTMQSRSNALVNKSAPFSLDVSFSWTHNKFVFRCHAVPKPMRGMIPLHLRLPSHVLWWFLHTAHLTSHAFTRANISRAWLKRTRCIFFVCVLSPKHSSSRAHVMFRTLLDPPLTAPSQSTPTSSSLLFP